MDRGLPEEFPLSRFVLHLGFAFLTACPSPTDKPGQDDTGGPPDADGDGFSAEEDCNDAEGAIHPDAEELCDGVDNDCDGVVDGAGATGIQTFYADSDGDGYGDPAETFQDCEIPSGHVADNTDCDDTSADTYPGADEFCDNVDTNCDGTVDDDSAVSHMDGAGLWTDVTADMSGTQSAVAEVTVDGGTYSFCPGIHFLQIEVLSSTVLVGSSGNAADVQISSLWEGRVIDVGEGIDLEVRDLHVKDGAENDNGGNIQCIGSESNPSTLVLDSVLVTDGTVTGSSLGGGLLLYFCDATLTDTTFSGNSAEGGAGVVSFFSNLVVQDCEFMSNTAANDVGGMAVVGDSFSTTVTITDTRFENNEALSGGGAGLLLAETAAVISGTGPGTCVFHGNSAGADEGGGIYLEEATLDVTGCDFGDAGTPEDNSGKDIYMDDADRTFDYGEGATFSCDDTNSNLGICTPGTYDIEVGETDSNYAAPGKLEGNIVEVTSEFTLESFGVWLDPDTGCNSLDFYVMTSSDASNWTMQWSDTVSTTTSSAGWQQSGAVGFTVTAGQYVATMVGWTCDATYFWSEPGDELLPFGTSDGTVSSIAYLGFDSAPWTSPYWYRSMTTDVRYPTTYNVTQ